MTAQPNPLDRSALDPCVSGVLELLREHDAPAPQVLFLLATGSELLEEALVAPRSFALEGPLCPPLWRGQTLFAGRLGELSAWVLTDVSSDPLGAAPQAAWHRGFPVWLAAHAGARVCVHVSAGSGLVPDDESPAPQAGGFALLRDHLNLSGETPLLGLGESRLGPLFPDLTRLHHIGLRRAALAHAAELGISAVEAVAACIPGPVLETPAERRFYARAGATVCVQGLAAPLLAAAHAGLSLLSIVAVTDADAGPKEVTELLARARAVETPLFDWLGCLAEDLEAAVSILEVEEES